MPFDIHVSAVLISDDEGRVLHVRKKGTHMFMLPGGKPEPGEHPRDTAAREFQEELGMPLTLTRLEPLGEFHATAANEAGYRVVAQVFTHPYVSGVTAAAEIEQVEWIHPTTTRTDIAPLNTHQLFPALQTGALTAAH